MSKSEILMLMSLYEFDTTSSIYTDKLTFPEKVEAYDKLKANKFFLLGSTFGRLYSFNEEVPFIVEVVKDIKLNINGIL